MRYYKRVLAAAVAAAMLQSTAAYGNQVVPPHPDSQTVAGPGETKPVGEQGSQTNNDGPANTGGTAVVDNLPDVSVLAIQSEGAIVINADTGQVLYAKNPDTRYYPASITKLMTALLVIEQTNMTDTVTFSEKATTNLESGSVSLGITKGDQLSVKDCLYGFLIKSANEIGNGLAEHTAGSIEAFVGQMNARAKAIGCTNTNFANPHGLNNSNHYTTPRDMAKIAAEAFKNDTLKQISSTPTYLFPATQKSGATTVTMGHKMLHKSDSRYYEGIIGGKTGYTSLAGNTLVTGAERNGVRLVAVIMKSKSTHYADTKLLLDYGFEQSKNQSQSQRSNQWVKDSRGDWYYYQADGTLMKSQWLLYKELWYYLGTDGKMLTNATTPDGYYVNEQGIWIR